MALLLVLAPAGLLRSQNPDYPESPSQVVEAYRRIDSGGGRLTPDGWRRASSFLLTSVPPPERVGVAVMRGERVDRHPVINGNRAQVWVVCSAIGRIDAFGRFTFEVSSPVNRPAGGAQRRKSSGRTSPSPESTIWC